LVNRRETRDDFRPRVGRQGGELRLERFRQLLALLTVPRIGDIGGLQGGGAVVHSGKRGGRGGGRGPRRAGGGGGGAGAMGDNVLSRWQNAATNPHAYGECADYGGGGHPTEARETPRG